MGQYAEGSVALHTWSNEGAALLDAYASGRGTLIDLVREVEASLANWVRSDSEGLVLMWTHDQRGRTQTTLSDLEDLHLEESLLVKRRVAGATTAYHHVEIWEDKDVEDTPSYHNILEHGLKPGDPKLLTSDYASPEMQLFLDGVLHVSDSDAGDSGGGASRGVFFNPD